MPNVQNSRSNRRRCLDFRLSSNGIKSTDTTDQFQHLSRKCGNIVPQVCFRSNSMERVSPRWCCKVQETPLPNRYAVCGLRKHRHVLFEAFDRR